MVPCGEFFVFDDPAGSHSFILNQKPLSEFTRERGGGKPYRILGTHLLNQIQILDSGRVVQEQALPRGIYVVNLSSQHWISCKQIFYGRGPTVAATGTDIPKSSVGVYRIADEDNLNAVVYSFDISPPETIRVRSRLRGNFIAAAIKNLFKNESKVKRIEETQYFDLKAGVW